MKKLVLIAILLLVPFFAAATVDKNCYQNYTAIKCGDQQILNLDEYCSAINLTVKDCSYDSNNLTVIFSGIQYFDFSNDLTKMKFSFYGRSWTWLGDEAPLPENSTITILGNSTFRITSPVGDKKVESVQITVPACYSKVNDDLEKIYFLTQTAKACHENKEEVSATNTAEPVLIPEPTENNEKEQPANITVSEQAVAEQNSAWILGILVVVVVIIGILALRPRKQRRPAKKKK